MQHRMHRDECSRSATHNHASSLKTTLRINTFLTRHKTPHDTLVTARGGAMPRKSPFLLTFLLPYCSAARCFVPWRSCDGSRRRTFDPFCFCFFKKMRERSAAKRDGRLAERAGLVNWLEHEQADASAVVMQGKDDGISGTCFAGAILSFVGLVSATDPLRWHLSLWGVLGIFGERLQIREAPTMGEACGCRRTEFERAYTVATTRSCHVCAALPIACGASRQRRGQKC
jgi:hypothetical protein